MSIWAPEPRREGTIPNYSILRTPPTTPITGVCLSDRPEGVRLHYWRGRSRPCPGGACPACQEGHVPRWKGYILIKAPESPKIVIFEFTERAWEAFDSRFRKLGTLRGSVFNARRTTRKVNGPLVVEFTDRWVDHSELPDPGDLRAMLERIWEINQKPLDFPANNEPELTYAG